MANSGPALDNVISSAFHWCKRSPNDWLYLEQFAGDIDVPFTLQNVIKLDRDVVLEISIWYIIKLFRLATDHSRVEATDQVIHKANVSETGSEFHQGQLPNQLPAR